MFPFEKLGIKMEPKQEFHLMLWNVMEIAKHAVFVGTFPQLVVMWFSTNTKPKRGSKDPHNHKEDVHGTIAIFSSVCHTLAL